MSVIHTVYGHPNIDSSAIVFPTAVVSGDVTLARGCNVWHHVTIRGDMAPITIGEDTNVQDNAVIHVNTDRPTLIGKRVTIGHGAIIHGCRIGARTLVGIGAIVLDG
ncbi:MAG: gamma carbonic anhydrase family protein, partial [Bacillota bacterium]|nr:gamma carbonic anhydrase family protein [Bacillota bacterium]